MKSNISIHILLLFDYIYHISEAIMLFSIIFMDLIFHNIKYNGRTLKLAPLKRKCFILHLPSFFSPTQFIDILFSHHQLHMHNVSIQYHNSFASKCYFAFNISMNKCLPSKQKTDRIYFQAVDLVI